MQPRHCYLVPFNLYKAEEPIRSVMLPNGWLQKFVLLVQEPALTYVCELATNN